MDQDKDCEALGDAVARIAVLVCRQIFDENANSVYVVPVDDKE